MFHSSHFSGDTRYLYFGYLLEMGKVKKKTRPMTSIKMRTQSSISPTSVTRRQQLKAMSECRVVRGAVQW